MQPPNSSSRGLFKEWPCRLARLSLPEAATDLIMLCMCSASRRFCSRWEAACVQHQLSGTGRVGGRWSGGTHGASCPPDCAACLLERKLDSTAGPHPHEFPRPREHSKACRMPRRLGAAAAGRAGRQWLAGASLGGTPAGSPDTRTACSSRSLSQLWRPRQGALLPPSRCGSPQPEPLRPRNPKAKRCKVPALPTCPTNCSCGAWPR